MSCSIEEIKTQCDAKPPVERVETPEWTGDGFVYVRAMRASESGSIREFEIEGASVEEQETAAIVGWCVLGVCDEDGNRLFANADHAWLKNSLLAPVMRCAQATWALNGATGDLVGNSETTQSDSSP